MEAQPRFAVLCLFQCFEEKEYQTESKRNEINKRSYFWKETHLMDLDPTSEDTGGAHEGGGAPTPLGCAPCLVGPPKLWEKARWATRESQALTPPTNPPPPRWWHAGL